MISKLLFAIERAFDYVRKHPHLLFVLILLVVFPLLFLYTGQQFLDVGRANQDRLQKDRIGIMHDSFAALLSATHFDAEIANAQLTRIAALNPDLVSYAVSKVDNGAIVPIVSSNDDLENPIGDPDLYRSASLRTDESLIFETREDGIRMWHAYRAVPGEDGILYFMYTKFSLASVDALFSQREQQAYFSLVFVYCFIIALALWHIKLTDYRYLYLSAKKTNEMRDLFTNMITHELRAPLTAIRGYADLAKDHAVDAEVKKYAERIKQSAERLITIVNDLLDIARIQSGKLQVTLGECDLSQTILEVIEELRVSADEKGITLSTSGAASPHRILADGKRLHQALTNLVSNAIKYTQHGGIEVALEEKPAAVEIRVKDSGMGISAEDQKQLFAPFFRVANDDVSKITGTGLGMWITKELIELMDGKIGVESIRGVGTHVVIQLKKVRSQ
jgi:signal transduction histidine kinase